MSVLSGSGPYARWAALRHIRKMNAASNDERRIKEAKQAEYWLERARRLRRDRKGRRGDAWTEHDEYYDLLTRSQIAPVALVAGDLDKAAQYANDILRTRDVVTSIGAPEHVDWGADEAYVGHIVLGKIAYAQGDIETASEHLSLGSRAARRSPVLDMSGPDTELAAALLEQGEREAVLDYLSRMRGVWRRGGDELDKWITAIESGHTPDFSRWTEVRIWRR